nr:MAG TPA: hypothetical protein [Caudoviricetes sp.]
MIFLYHNSNKLKYIPKFFPNKLYILYALIAF